MIKVDEKVANLARINVTKPRSEKETVISGVLLLSSTKS